MNRRGFFGMFAAFAAALGWKPKPKPWRYDILYGSMNAKPDHAIMLIDDPFETISEDQLDAMRHWFDQGLKLMAEDVDARIMAHRIMAHYTGK